MQVRDAFRGSDPAAFAARLAGLWAASLLPFAALAALRDRHAALGYATYEELIWAVKPFPLFRLPEFVMGMALAQARAPPPQLERRLICAGPRLAYVVFTPDSALAQARRLMHTMRTHKHTGARARSHARTHA